MFSLRLCCTTKIKYKFLLYWESRILKIVLLFIITLFVAKKNIVKIIGSIVAALLVFKNDRGEGEIKQNPKMKENCAENRVRVVLIRIPFCNCVVLKFWNIEKLKLLDHKWIDTIWVAIGRVSCSIHVINAFCFFILNNFHTSFSSLFLHCCVRVFRFCIYRKLVVIFQRMWWLHSIRIFLSSAVCTCEYVSTYSSLKTYKTINLSIFITFSLSSLKHTHTHTPFQPFVLWKYPVCTTHSLRVIFVSISSLLCLYLSLSQFTHEL